MYLAHFYRKIIMKLSNSGFFPAQKRNAENLVFITDSKLAQEYIQN
jgi:hypothetical protein